MFVSLWCTSELPTPSERNQCMTEIYFWCFSSSKQYFLCLIKISILASPLCRHNFSIPWQSMRYEWWTYLENQSNMMWKGSRLIWLISICLNKVNCQTVCGRALLHDRQRSQFQVYCSLVLIPILFLRKTLYLPFSGTTCNIKNQQMFQQYQGSSSMADPLKIFILLYYYSVSQTNNM